MLFRSVHLEIDDKRALFPLLQATHKTPPTTLSFDRKGILVVGRGVWLQAKYLQACATRLVHNEPCAEYSRVVEDQECTFGQLLGEVVELAMGDFALSPYQTVGVVTLRERELCDSLVG